MMTWSTAAPAVSAAFFASVVEVVEAFTIVLAVATLRGWRPAALGTAAGLGVLAAGVIPLHDEDAIFAAEAAELTEQEHRRRRNLGWAAGVAAFKAVLLEGLE